VVLDTYHHMKDSRDLRGLHLVAKIMGTHTIDVEREFNRHRTTHWGSVGEWVNALIHGRTKANGLDALRLHRLHAALELASLMAYEELCARPALNTPLDCEHYLRCHLRGRDRELFCAVYLNARNRVLACQDLFEGTVDGAAVYPRDVVAAALNWGASAVIVAHNHPSGSLDPSEADRQITHRLRDALSLVDIRLLDHLIVARGGIYSMASYCEAGF